jgi:VanZ family protein
MRRSRRNQTIVRVIQGLSRSMGQLQDQAQGQAQDQAGDAQGNNRATWPRMVKPGLAWGWSLLIVLICLSPNTPSPPSGFPWDKLAHLLLFGGFGGLWHWTYPRAMVKVAIAGATLGLAIELLQSVMNMGRMGDGLDFLADCLGLFLGLVLPAQLRRLLAPRP